MKWKNMNVLKTPDSNDGNGLVSQLSTAQMLCENLLKNIDSKLKSIDVCKLYNDILLEKEEMHQTSNEITLYDYIQCHLIKMYSYGLNNEYTYLIGMYKFIYKVLYNRYLALHCICFCENIKYVLPKQISYSNMYT